MFLKYIDFIFQPFRAIYNKWLGVKNIQGNFKVDVNRAKAMGKRGQQFMGDANAKVAQYAGGGQQQQQQAAGANGQPAQQGYQPQMGYQQPQQPQMGYQQQPQNFGYQQGAQNMQPGMPPMGAPRRRASFRVSLMCACRRCRSARKSLTTTVSCTCRCARIRRNSCVLTLMPAASGTTRRYTIWRLARACAFPGWSPAGSGRVRPTESCS